MSRVEIDLTFTLVRKDPLESVENLDGLQWAKNVEWRKAYGN
jgi:hypothetical protein